MRTVGPTEGREDQPSLRGVSSSPMSIFSFRGSDDVLVIWMMEKVPSLSQRLFGLDWALRLSVTMGRVAGHF